MQLSRSDFINIIAKDTGASPHLAENMLNSIFCRLKEMLDDKTIDAVAQNLEADDLSSVWLSAEAAEDYNYEADSVFANDS